MAKGRSADLTDLITPEQAVEHTTFPDMQFLVFPRQAYEEVTAVAHRRGMTFAMAITQAIEAWLKKED